MKGQHTELRLSFSKAFSGGNAVISPEQGDDFYFTLIGSGTIAKQNAVSESIVTAVNTYPAVTELVEALEACQASIALMIEPKAIKSSSVISAFTQAFEADCKARSALTHYRELAGTSNEGAK